jgi:hypothetical protein
METRAERDAEETRVADGVLEIREDRAACEICKGDTSLFLGGLTCNPVLDRSS